MNIVILIAVMVQWFVSSKNRLWGSILGLLITLGIAFWGALVYLSGYTMEFFGFTLSPLVFFLMFLAWTGYDIFLVIQAAQAVNRTVTLRMADETSVFGQMDPHSPIVRRLMKDEDITIRAQSKTVKGVKWLELVNSSGKKEYILGNTPILQMFSILQDKVNIYRRPDRNSQIIEVVRKDGLVEIVRSEKANNEDWVLIRTPITAEGYMLGNTQGKML